MFEKTLFMIDKNEEMPKEEAKSYESNFLCMYAPKHTAYVWFA